MNDILSAVCVYSCGICLLYIIALNFTREEPAKGVVCCTVSAFALWFGAFMFMKYSLRILYMYKGELMPILFDFCIVYFQCPSSLNLEP